MEKPKREQDFKLKNIKERPYTGEKKESFEKQTTEVNQNNDEFDDSFFEKIYELKNMKKIGRGYKTAVYKIVSNDLKTYAVKETDRDLMPIHYLDRMRQINHPKVVKLYDFREKNHDIYILIEYMNFTSFEKVIHMKKN